MNSVTNTLDEKNLTSNIPLNTTCLGVVLAGGLSSRMGENKADLAHFADHQRSMLNYSQQTLKNSGIHHIVVSSAYQASSISGIAESTVNHQHQVNDKFRQLGPLDARNKSQRPSSFKAPSLPLMISRACAYT